MPPEAENPIKRHKRLKLTYIHRIPPSQLEMQILKEVATWAFCQHSKDPFHCEACSREQIWVVF